MTKDALAGKITEVPNGDEPSTYTKDPGTGFGVFAYYTGLETYGVFQGYNNNTEGTKNTAQAPNFMYNQKVYAELSNNASDDIYWTYSPLKYWPNDFSDGKVDNQTPNAAEGSGENGGYVSFFAYAPYVESTPATGAVTDNTTGITAMTNNSTTGDPKITYKLPSNVDLLWGTLESAGPNVVNGNNAGVSHKSDGDAYEQAIKEGKEEGQYTVAADLTKQKIDGQVKFNFIHALAGIGGSTEAVGGDVSKDPEASGFKVMLDIDNSVAGEVSDAITGGDREMFKIVDGKAVALAEGDATNNEVVKYYRTIVTLRKVSITNNLDGDENIDDEENGEYGDERLYSEGVLNLATGQWKSDLTNDATDGGKKGGAELEQTIGGGSGALAMNSDIAEYDEGTTTSYFKPATDSEILEYFIVNNEKYANGVVEKKAKNVYEDATVSPILLIPGQAPKFRVNVEYVVRQYDDALSKKYTEVVNNITKIVEFPEVKMNTHYTIIMRLGLTSVKFTAVVSDWSTGTGEPGTKPTPDGNENSGNNGNVEILLPSNVIDSPQPQP